MRFLFLFVLLCCSACGSTNGQRALSSYQAPPQVIKSLPQIAEDLNKQTISSVELVTLYLQRIERMDRAGPELRSMISLNPAALEEARARDLERQQPSAKLGALHGIPVVIKDNIDSKDQMPTTAGALALANNFTHRDSPLVAGLRDAGAIILGKTNLSQWANFRSEFSISGWSALGGQVRNPHMLDRSPCGSSSGSAVAVAASLAAAGVGTETNGSIICPANVNGVVGFKPTVGVISQQFIVPISASQDTAGPLTKTVTGAAMLMNAMQTGPDKIDYLASLDAEALRGVRIGVLRFSEGSNPDIVSAFNAALDVLKAAGATLVDINQYQAGDENTSGASFKVLLYEFKSGLNDYLAQAAEAVETQTLEQLIRYNEQHADTELALFDQGILEQAQALGPLTDEAYLAAKETIQKNTRERGIDGFMAEHKVDFLVSPSGPIAGRIDPVNGDVWPAWAGAGSIAAIAGYPHASVPMGQVHGIPIGLSFMGKKNDDAKILSYAYAYEQLTKLYVNPAYLEHAEDLNGVNSAMQGVIERR